MIRTLGLFPLSTVLFPGAALRLHVFEERYKELIGGCISRREAFGVVLDRNGKEVGDELDPVGVGTAARILEVAMLNEGRMFIVTRGVARFRIEEILQKQPFFSARVSFLREPLGSSVEAPALTSAAGERFNDYLQALLALLGGEFDDVEVPDDATATSYLIADTLQVPPVVKQRLLEAESAAQRLRLEIMLMDAETRRLRSLKAGESEATARPDAQAPFDVKFSIN